ncbi:MAG TPA: T9SS type A sorting domain-containing protein [Puia sp.]|uniref:T9SS type A sorting domain-containing protein n=1 Tax=Puia sp. TaxID=2045100 RepID=UPI002CCDED4A|nr:T9SS type A sorting domain-containing protein [Puia sp.]HVU98335.1 T9SS type A sorting domain-containing protein [Puia sp.]
MRKTLPTLILFIALSAGLENIARAQVISQFGFEAGSILTADIGANATSVSGTASLVTPGNAGGHGVAPNSTNDINLVVPGAQFEVPGLDISIDFVRAENTAGFFTLGGMDIGINTGAIYAKFQLDNGGAAQNISLANFLSVPTDANFHTYRFDYDNVSGTFRAWLDGTLKYTNVVGATGQALYWVGATNATIGSGMNGNGAHTAVLDNFIATTPLFVLPLSITAFDAVADKGAAALSFNAAATGGFTIERSADGSNFSTIGAVQPQPDNTDVYHFTDNTPAAVNYYRVTAVAMDGSVAYSPIRKLTFLATGATIRCYPNPVVDYATIRLDNGTPETVRLNVTTLDGRLVRSGQLTANPGQDITLDLTNAPKGILLVSLGTNDHEETLKILKN